MCKLSYRAGKVTASAIREILKLSKKPGMVSLAGGLPSPLMFPIQEIRSALNGLMTNEPDACLQYGETEGLLDLRVWIANKHSTRGISLNAENVLITTGSQQALDLLGKALIDPGDCVLVENPSYLGALQAFSMYQPEFEVLPEQNGNVDFDRLQNVPIKFKLAYLIPNFQNPTGRLMSLEARRKFAEFVERSDGWIVEDDPYGEIQFTNETIPALRTLAPNKTIYLGSFSKTLAPGLRVGYVIAEPKVIKALALLKQSADLHTSTLSQKIVLSLLTNGAYERQLDSIRQYYHRQSMGIVAAMNRYFPSEVKFEAPAGGMFVWCELPESISASELLVNAIENDVAFVPGEHFYVKNPKPQTLRLSFATPSLEAINSSIEVLGELIKKRLA